ncbi:protein kinase domain-containing protein [Kribbella sp. NPDC054772]
MTERELLAGRYRLDGLLGRGGMSEVFYGYDERLDRRVAIKLLRQSVVVPSVPDSPEAVEIRDSADRDRKRFLREIRTTAQLEHPGVPAVYDTGVETGPDGNPRVWLVMQLLRGTTLEAVLDGTDFHGALPSVPWVAAVVAQIAAVLADVHRIDVVHRDIKPTNLMLIDGGLVKVLDFGIAILRGSGALPRLTQVDRTVGTPAYMSPEQGLGRVVTAASDIYSLGCLLCELLTGDVPFHGTVDTPLRTHHLQTPPPSALQRRHDVPDEVAALMTAMLAKDASARPTAEQVYETLLETARHGSGDGEDDTRDPTRPFRRPLLAPSRPRARVSSRGPLTEDDLRQLQGNVEVLLGNNRPQEAIRLLEGGVERSADDPALALSLRHSLGAALYYAGEYTRSAGILEAVGRDYRKYLAPGDPVALDCAYHAGHAYAEVGKPGLAVRQLRYYVENIAQDSANADAVLQSRFVIAQMLAADDHLDEALSELLSVRPLLVAAFGPDSTHIRNLDKQIGRLSRQGG